MSRLAEVSSWELDKVVVTGLELLACEFQEEKRLGVLFLKARGSELDADRIDQIAEAIDAHVYDWATCDILAGGVLREIDGRLCSLSTLSHRSWYAFSIQGCNLASIQYKAASTMYGRQNAVVN